MFGLWSTTTVTPFHITSGVEGLLHFSLFSSTLQPAPAIPESWNIEVSRILNNTARSETAYANARFFLFLLSFFITFRAVLRFAAASGLVITYPHEFEQFAWVSRVTLLLTCVARATRLSCRMLSALCLIRL